MVSQPCREYVVRQRFVTAAYPQGHSHPRLSSSAPYRLSLLRSTQTHARKALRECVVRGASSLNRE